MLKKLLNKVKVARTIGQLDKITKEAYSSLSNSEIMQIDQAIQDRIRKQTMRAR